jgi:hypothetical protein
MRRLAGDALMHDIEFNWCCGDGSRVGLRHLVNGQWTWMNVRANIEVVDIWASWWQLAGWPLGRSLSLVAQRSSLPSH